jgi:polygalacturonase/rhamnogalacturonyl hydrolase YesR
MARMGLFYSSVKRGTLLCWLGSVVISLAGCATAPTTAEEGWRTLPAILKRITPPVFHDKDYAITDYGAVGDGRKDCTDAFRKAIAACNADDGGRVVVGAGTYLTGAIHLKSNVNLHLAKDAVIRFSTNPDDYLPAVYTRFESTECMNYSPLIYAWGQDNIAITGQGVLDGGADPNNWWQWTQSQKPNVKALCDQAEKQVAVDRRIYGRGHFLRPNMIQFYRCKNILIDGVTVRNSPMWHINPVLSSNITVRNVTVVGHGPNNDGCDPESCKDVLIENCYFDTGDDCIAIKSGRNADGRRVNVASENIIIRKCTMKDGHGGVVIGSEVSGSVRNVFVEDCMMDSPNLDRGLRIKTNSVRGGVIENIFMRNTTIKQVAEAALKIDFYYQEADTGTFTPVVQNVYMTSVRCYKSQYPWHMRGYARSPIKNVVLKDCVFENTQKEGVAEAVEGFVVSTGKEDPPPQTPKWSDRMIRSEMQRNPESWMLDFSKEPKWKYAIGVELKAIWLAGLREKNEAYLNYVQGYYDKLIAADGKIETYDPESYNIDNICPGKTLLDLYKHTPQEKYKKALVALREQMKTHPRVSDSGFWHKKIYPHQMWLDGIYMGTPFLAQYGIVFDKPALFDEAANQIILMNRHARDDKTGLLYHGWDESKTQKWADPKTGCSPNFWGRSMGWYLMAIVDTLDYLPIQYPQRKEVLDILNQTVEAVSRYQDPQTGVWYQVLDKQKEEGNYIESSCSCMFTYAILKAVRNGYVPEKYRAVAEKGYQGILKQFVETASDGQVHLHKGCAVAGLGGKPYRDGSYRYYIGEKIRSNDPKAVGPFILASLEYEMIH